MAISKTRIHIICGLCGDNTMMKFKIKSEISDKTGEKYHAITIICDNCSSTTGLDEILKEIK